MSRPLEALAEEILQLTPEARTRLLNRLVASLDAVNGRDAAWDALASNREAQTGEGQYVPLSDALERLRAELE